MSSGHQHHFYKRLSFWVPFTMIIITTLIIFSIATDDTPTKSLDEPLLNEHPSPDEVAGVFEVYEFNGTGDETTEGFEIENGLAMIDLTHEGEGSFSVQLNDQSGDSQTLVDVTGGFDGRLFMSSEETEQYTLAIQAEDNWSISVDQNLPESIDDEPHQLTGSGYEAIYIGLTEGDRQFNITHDGDEAFLVTLNQSFVLVDESGEFDDTITVEITSDQFAVIEIQAYDNWSIEIE
ncbi:hypothetical protein SAMN05421734_102260 [Pelagirhabdus alkalitolerans]|uniref:Uncharacterized protein n=1 Tax=Pelagirhabdus alkalitolerans TaxID=1612202 RepID=A0A1G6H5D6_9BACI|nr:hypothetical protein [Pelagirhabdus alkalitolerans]SDB89500.1 hypothetical protein SAMN05421734_102260 [Pelagirhabdus alkalitolerans]